MATSSPHDAASAAPPSFSIPRLRDLGRHALPTVIEGTVVPVLVFWLAVRLLGPWTALLVGLAWVYVTIVRRLLLRRRVPGVLVIAAVTATCRVVVAFSTHSIVLYFLQPSVGTVMTALAFLVSAWMGRPLAARLAHDFCPLPDGWAEQSWVRRFFLRISLLWGLVFLANAAFTAWLALSQSVETIALARPAGAGVLTLTAIGVSVAYFRRTLHRHQGPAGVVLEGAR